MLYYDRSLLNGYSISNKHIEKQAILLKLRMKLNCEKYFYMNFPL
jgi:hypothetical protein